MMDYLPTCYLLLFSLLFAQGSQGVVNVLRWVYQGEGWSFRDLDIVPAAQACTNVLPQQSGLIKVAWMETVVLRGLFFSHQSRT